VVHPSQANHGRLSTSKKVIQAGIALDRKQLWNPVFGDAVYLQLKRTPSKAMRSPIRTHAEALRTLIFCVLLAHSLFLFAQPRKEQAPRTAPAVQEEWPSYA